MQCVAMLLTKELSIAVMESLSTRNVRVEGCSYIEDCMDLLWTS